MNTYSEGFEMSEPERKYPCSDTNPLGRAPKTSVELLDAARGIQASRAKEYDQPGGERSMGRTVAAFNAVTGRDLTEAEGWMFMIQLKLVRGQSAKTPHQDSAEDAVSYSALYGEARLADR